MAKKKKYYLPKAFAELTSWLRNFIETLAEHPTRFGVPKDVFDDLEEKASEFYDANIVADSHNAGKVDKALRRDKANTVSKAVRNVVNRYLRYNDDITDDQKVNLGIPVRDIIKTNIDPPKTYPGMTLRINDYMNISISLREPGSKSKAKPYGTIGALIKYDVLDAKPLDHTQLSRSVLATRTPRIIRFPASERGCTAYISAAWQNEKGETGPWTLIQSILIP
ncbi:MAG: hypothetical protein LBS54_08795 [Dysgonamonadaceae bacterium]|jgi:hypothetical protein|nr:hypothetical protein [Dysgonamonadaceae bacterium]